MRQTLRRIIAVSLLMFSAALLSASVSPASPRCRTRNLALDQVRFGSGGSFRDYLDMALVNISPSDCSVSGWPRVQMLDAHARPIRIRIVRSHPASPTPITLGTGQRAYFTIHFRGGEPCQPKDRVAHGVRVTPPGGSGGLVVAERLDMCALTLPVTISIDPVRAHRGQFPPAF